MLPAVSQPIVASTGSEHMQMGMVLAITPVRMEDHDIAPLEWLAFDGAVELIQALDPTAHKRTQHDRRVLVEGGAEQRRHRQNDVPIDDPFMEDLTHLAHPGIDMELGTPEPQRRFTANGHQMLALAAVQTAVLDVPDLFWIATCEHLRHQTIVVGRLIARMGVLKPLPMIGKDLLKDTPVPGGCCKHPRPPSEG